MDVAHNILTWVFFVSQGIADHTDLMRVSILCMEIIHQGDSATPESIMKSSAYLGCIHNIPATLLSEDQIQEMIDFNK